MGSPPRLVGQAAIPIVAGQMARGEKPRYDGKCRYLAEPPEGANPVVRFKNPQEGHVVVDDLIRGRVIFDNRELDDLIIARADGTPTYNMTVVVDDLDMGITHVIRGDDHINNTPRQINILEALGAGRPRYAHVPMIMGADGKRLSKRHGAVSVMEYREQGFLPEALLNYLVRLGWSHGDQEIFSVDEMIALFDVTDVHSSPASLDPDKLAWFNQHYLKACDPAHVAHHLSWHMGKLGIDPADGPELTQVVLAQRERAKTLVEMARNSVFFYQDFEAFDEKAAGKHLKPAVLQPLTDLRGRLKDLDPWGAEALHAAIEAVAARARAQARRRGPAGAGGGLRRAGLAAHRRDPGAARPGQDPAAPGQGAGVYPRARLAPNRSPRSRC